MQILFAVIEFEREFEGKVDAPGTDHSHFSSTCSSPKARQKLEEDTIRASEVTFRRSIRQNQC